MNATEYFVPKAKDMEEKIKVTSTQNWVVDDGLTFSGSYLVWWSECRWHTEFNELCALVVTDCKNIDNLATMTIKYQQASSYMVLQQKSMFLHNKIMPLELVCYKTACIWYSTFCTESSYDYKAGMPYQILVQCTYLSITVLHNMVDIYFTSLIAESMSCFHIILMIKYIQQITHFVSIQ